MSKKSEQSEAPDLDEVSALRADVNQLKTTVGLLESQVKGLVERQAGRIPEAAEAPEVNLEDPDGSDIKVRLLRNYHDATHGKILAGTMLVNVPRPVAQQLQDSDAGRIQAEV